jgi:hypothetical protein
MRRSAPARLQRAGSTASDEPLLGRMRAKIDGLCSQRDALNKSSWQRVEFLVGGPDDAQRCTDQQCSLIGSHYVASSSTSRIAGA